MKEKEKQEQVYCGCNPSVLDGTEHILEIDDKIAIPEEFSWQYAMPPVRNQGTTSTCVCLTLTGMLDFYHNSLVDTPNKCNKYSINELYGIRANKRVEGMTIKEALVYLRKHGLSGQKIDNYAKINSSEVIKHAIVMFGPVAAGLRCYSGDTLNFWRKKGQYLGGHCVTFVGYDKKGFIVRNSWGTLYGKGGYHTLPYDEFSSACFEAWTFAL